MSERYNAFLLQGDVGRADFEVQGLELPEETSLERLRDRRDG